VSKLWAFETFGMQPDAETNHFASAGRLRYYATGNTHSETYFEPTTF